MPIKWNEIRRASLQATQQIALSVTTDAETHDPSRSLLVEGQGVVAVRYTRRGGATADMDRGRQPVSFLRC